MTKNFDLKSYFYTLPNELIADRPTLRRDDCRLLVYNESTDKITHTYFHQLPEYIASDDLLVLNNSKVIACRVIAQKSSGGRAEIFFLSTAPIYESVYKCLIRSNGKKRVGDTFELPGNKFIEIKKVSEGYFEVYFEGNLEKYLEKFGQMPIPPYIRSGQADEKDRSDYQNVFAKNIGSVAAPTAGLHFNENLLNKFNHACVTLHVGLGTFKPVQSESILDHQMHSEDFFVEKEQALKIEEAKKIVAVGTTSLRVLESSYSKDQFCFSTRTQSTNIFLHPGVEVKSIHGLITNFHLPGSSLLMLVSSLIGRSKTLEIYEEAIKEKYRFYSYGDAMLILRKNYV